MPGLVLLNKTRYCVTRVRPLEGEEGVTAAAQGSLYLSDWRDGAELGRREARGSWRRGWARRWGRRQEQGQEQGQEVGRRWGREREAAERREEERGREKEVREVELCSCFSVSLEGGGNMLS